MAQKVTQANTVFADENVQAGTASGHTNLQPSTVPLLLTYMTLITLMLPVSLRSQRSLMSQMLHSCTRSPLSPWHLPPVTVRNHAAHTLHSLSSPTVGYSTATAHHNLGQPSHQSQLSIAITAIPVVAHCKGKDLSHLSLTFFTILLSTQGQ